MQDYKLPVSVLVVIHTRDLQILLLERADHPGYWQSVTGSQNPGETLTQTAIREVHEETGIDASEHSLIDWQIQNQYEIYEEWRWRYPPGVTHNTEHVFSLEVLAKTPVNIAAREHLGHIWLPWQAAADKVFSASNAQAIRWLASKLTAE
ncbi:MAG TPA: dihydroneopterin triphosphate diphosphatase [Nitrosomonas halophila]|nr:dihydroneopterin triphosphate diphosphatase [Nitrosomonas halophila]